jgi:hypothetical protein
MESDICQSPIVKQAIVVGRNCQCTGCLTSLDDKYSSSLSPDEIVSAVRDAVDRANTRCPKHSFILPRMVKILPPSASITMTAKGTIMRRKTELDFKDVIEDLYAGLIKKSTTDKRKTKTGFKKESKL